MSSERPNRELCSEVEQKLSAFIDSELTELERLGMERHLETCPGCRQELEVLAEASGFLREKGRIVPEAPPWESIRETVNAPAQLGSTWRRWLTVDRAIAASIGLVVVTGLLFAVARGEWSRGPESAAGSLEEPRVQLAGLPGLAGFLADHRAQEVDAADLHERLDFAPQVPEQLPGGFRLERAYVVRDRGYAGSCLIYRRGDELVSLVQHSPSHPLSWTSARLQGCIIAGRICRRGRGREVEVLQIEPEGRNLTVVVRAGGIDPAEFVRALSGS